MKKLLSGIALIPLVAGLLATGCEVEVGNDKSKIATWVGWPADGAREAENSTIFRFSFTNAVTDLKLDDITITEEGASGYAEKSAAAYVAPDLRADPEGKVWLLGGLIATQEGLAKVTIENDNVEKTLHGVPVFKELLPRQDYTAVKFPAGNIVTDKITLTFNAWTYSEYLGDESIPGQSDIYLEGDAFISGPIEVNGYTIDIPIVATKVSGGPATVYISKAGISKTGRTVANLIGRAATLVTAVPNGNSEETTSEITLTFDKDVDLSYDTVGNANSKVSYVSGPGSIPAAPFTGGGREWTLPVNVTSNGTLKLNFNWGNDITPVYNRDFTVTKSKATWWVEGQNSSGGNPQFYSDNDTNATTSQLQFTFSDSSVNVADTVITIDGDATKGTYNTSTKKLGITTSKTGTIKVNIADNASVMTGSQTVQVYKYVAPPPPPPSPPPSSGGAAPAPANPENKDPFKAGYPAQVNPAGKNLQVEVYKKNYSSNSNPSGPNLYFPYGDSTREQVTGHKDWYEVEIMSADGSKPWKKITTAPQVSASGVLGQYYCVYWPVTPSARSGMGKIIVRIRARNSDNPANAANWGDWVLFNNGGKGW